MKKSASIVLAACTLVASFAAVHESPENDATLATREVSTLLERKLGTLSLNCSYTAQAAHAAEENAAWSDFWYGVGNAFNDTSTPLLVSAAGLWADLQDTMAENAAIHAARIALCQALGNAPYDPVIDPNMFSSNITNQYLPFPVGRVLVEDGFLDNLDGSMHSPFSVTTSRTTRHSPTAPTVDA